MPYYIIEAYTPDGEHLRQPFVGRLREAKAKAQSLIPQESRANAFAWAYRPKEKPAKTSRK
jgi:hypothetical protein